LGVEGPAGGEAGGLDAALYARKEGGVVRGEGGGLGG